MKQILIHKDTRNEVKPGDKVAYLATIAESLDSHNGLSVKIDGCNMTGRFQDGLCIDLSKMPGLEVIEVLEVGDRFLLCRTIATVTEVVDTKVKFSLDGSLIGDYPVYGEKFLIHGEVIAQAAVDGYHELKKIKSSNLRFAVDDNGVSYIKCLNGHEIKPGDIIYCNDRVENVVIDIVIELGCKNPIVYYKDSNNTTRQTTVRSE